MPKVHNDPRLKEAFRSASVRKQYRKGLKAAKREADGSRLVDIKTPDGKTMRLRVSKATAS